MELDGGGFRGPEASLVSHSRPLYSPRFDASRALRLLKEIGTSVTEELASLMPTLLSFLKHEDPSVVRQSIASGTLLLPAILEKMALQLNSAGEVDSWLEAMWIRMVQFRAAVHALLDQPDAVGTKLLALKFLEVCILLFSPTHENQGIAIAGSVQNFTIFQFQGHPKIGRLILEIDVSQDVALLLDFLHTSPCCGSFLIVVINCVATIARTRLIYFHRILSALLKFNPSFEMPGAHSASVRYSLRKAFLGFLKCSHPAILESKEKLQSALETLNSVEEQMKKHMDKPSDETELSTDDASGNKDHVQASKLASGGRKRPSARINDSPSMEHAVKRNKVHSDDVSTEPLEMSSNVPDHNDSSNFPDFDQSPAQKMLLMIGALLAEGKRGAESIALLVSNLDADLLADIVMEAMKHLPDVATLHSAQDESPLACSQTSSSFSPEIPSTSRISQFEFVSPIDGNKMSDDVPAITAPLVDIKRDPRRDPRRLDPRRTAAPVGQNSVPLDATNAIEAPHGALVSNSSDVVVHQSVAVVPSTKIDKSDKSFGKDCLVSEEKVNLSACISSMSTSSDVQPTRKLEVIPEGYVEQDLDVPIVSSEDFQNDGVDGSILELDRSVQLVSTESNLEDLCHDTERTPVHLELNGKEENMLHKLLIQRIINNYEQNLLNECPPLLAYLFSLNHTNEDILQLLRMHIIFEYHRHKGHELAIHILYYLHAAKIDDSQVNSSIASCYEEFLIAVAKGLIDTLPPSDKSLGRLLCEAPCLPDSVFKLLDDLCNAKAHSHHEKDVDIERVTQGLGAIWSLILSRPPSREFCLDIALNCAISSQHEIREKAIRLITNKLYLRSYAAEKVEKFAVDMFMSVVDEPLTEIESNCQSSEESKEVVSEVTSVSCSKNLEQGASDSISLNSSVVSQRLPSVSLLQANSHTSLFFALCMKKPSLLRLVFSMYGKASKAVKQSIHRQMPIIVRNMESSCHELMKIIYDMPERSENLVTLVLQILTEESTPSADVVVAIKGLYETKLKDVFVLIPILSLLSKEEVLPIFPKLVELPLEKFKEALARILQGSAHTGPALTPTEVLIAIHDIDPDKDKVARKQITDACTACLEQRTVFTQQVLTKAFTHLVERVPLPFLFMRTVIQAIDAFPAMVDFVMGLLSELVVKKIWKMPQLWAGFVKCAYQTRPHSFHVLLELPAPQLENVLSRCPDLRAPLASHVNEQSKQALLSRQTLTLLGLASEMQ